MFAKLQTVLLYRVLPALFTMLMFSADVHPQATEAIIVNSTANSEILRIHFPTGSGIGAFVTRGSGGLGTPTGLVFGPDGFFYVGSTSGIGGVLRYDNTTGAFKDVFVPAFSGGLTNPQGLAFGPDGNLYVASLDPGGVKDAVLRYNGKSGAFIDEFVTS